MCPPLLGQMTSLKYTQNVYTSMNVHLTSLHSLFPIACVYKTQTVGGKKKKKFGYFQTLTYP